MKKEKKLICQWCEQKKTGSYIPALDKKGQILAWACWGCQKKLYETQKVSIKKR